MEPSILESLVFSINFIIATYYNDKLLFIKHCKYSL